jgi:hypothetical protein
MYANLSTTNPVLLHAKTPKLTKTLRRVSLKHGNYVERTAAKFVFAKYSIHKTKARGFITAAPSITHGPDMYHVYLGSLLVLNVWQPMHLPETIEICDMVQIPSTYTLIKVDNNSNTSVREQLLRAVRKRYEVADTGAPRLESVLPSVVIGIPSTVPVTKQTEKKDD